MRALTTRWRRPGRLQPKLAWPVFVGAMVALHSVKPDGVVGALTYFSVGLVAAVMAWWGLVRETPAERARWWWIALGVTLSAVGDGYMAFSMIFLGVIPDLSPGDVFWLGAYVALVVGLVRVVPFRGPDRRLDVSSLLDLLAVAIVGLLVVWYFSVRATLADPLHPLSIRLIWSAYPILDAVLLVLVVRLLSAGPARAVPARPLVLGALCWLVGDFANLILDPVQAMVAWNDAAWMIGSTLLGYSVWRAKPEAFVADPDDDRAPRWRVLTGVAPLVVPALLAVVSSVRHEGDDAILMLITTGALTTLVFLQVCRSLGAAESAQRRVHASERHYRALAANSSDGVVLVDPDGRLLNDSPTLAVLAGRPGASTAGVHISDIIHPDDIDDVRAILARALLNPTVVFDAEFRVRHADGRYLWFGARAVNLLHDPDVNGVVVNIQDVTDRKAAEARLSHQAFHDPLTGLANRALLRQRVEHVLRRPGRTGQDSAVIYLDLDGFKNVNDSLGHDAGDHLLRDVARRLQAAVRAGDTVARLGGDEFAVLLENNRYPREDAVFIAERILVALREPVTVEGLQICVSASVGIAIAGPETTAASALRNADVAMYRAKAAGKNQWVVYEPQMRAEAVERLRLEADLATAIEHEQLRLEYQPVVDLATRRIVGCEALLRWDHPTFGTVPPDKFVPVAEETGLIAPIGRWVLETACRAAAHFLSLDGVDPDFTMAVNVSGRQVETDSFVAEVSDALALARLAPDALVLEMTESVLVRDASIAARCLQQLRSLGVRLAIDDFGTGYSSLSYLRQFPIDILKIDRSFVSGVSEGAPLPPILKGLLDLGHTLGLDMVAEGIEHPWHLDALLAEGCHLGQGYLFSRPLGRQAVEDLVASLGKVMAAA
jgi:diguanylate cyclase (GGDEF)-like protein/PAS domain S-box-containing protein